MSEVKIPLSNLTRSDSRPYFPNVGVIGLGPEPWEHVWMPRHHILSRLDKYFHVVWANPPLEWRHQWFRKKDRQCGKPQVTRLASGLRIYTPGRWLPRFYKPALLAQLTERQRLRQMQQILTSLGVDKFILYLWRPFFAPALDAIDHDISCYHIDDEYTFSQVELPTKEAEVNLLQRVDQVFIHSPALMDKKGHYNPNTLFVPNGVDYAAYSSAHDEPLDMESIPHPRIGYVGRLKMQLDLPLLITLARRHMGWSFVLVGPEGFLGEHKDTLAQLETMSNVYFLGSKPKDQLPAYNQHMDVCMLCYAVDDYTKFIYPLKLHEYLATGRPVVGSPIRSLLDFAQVIKLAQTPDEWSRALADSLDGVESSAAKVEQRRRIAQKHDWSELTHRIAQTLCTRLGPTYSSRFAKIDGQQPITEASDVA